MRYLGGKFRVAGQIADVLRSYHNASQMYVEPFVGAGWVLEKMSGMERRAYDVNNYLIALYRALQDGWEPPDGVTEEVYLWAKSSSSCPDYMKGFIGFGCSWGGKWFGGYARGGAGRDYSSNAKRSLLRMLPRIQDVRFACSSYERLSMRGSLIYCDPPYENTTEYGFCNNFNFPLFWDIMRRWSKENTVIISGYVAPSDFTCLLEMGTRTDMRGRDGTMLRRIERLFKYQVEH